jgi:hypothetical protein
MKPDDESEDVLLRALRELPRPSMDEPIEARQRRAARAAFARAFEDEPWHTRLFGSAGRAVVPVVLASVIGVYLTWAITTASALVH